MTRYKRVQEAIRAIEHQISHKDVRDLLLVVDLPNHREELGSVHVDTARAAMDWFCKRHPNHPICLASASRQNTKKAWKAFGYDHLSREYEWFRFVDLNREPMPEMSFTVFMTTLHHHPVHGVRRPSRAWVHHHAQPQQRYTPSGHVWGRYMREVSSRPDMVVVDAHVAREHDGYFEPVARRREQVFASVALEDADKVCCALYE